MKKITAVILIAILLMMCGCSTRTRETADETIRQTEAQATQDKKIPLEETTAVETATVTLTQAVTEEETTTVKEKTTSEKNEKSTSVKADKKTTQGSTKQSGDAETTKSAIGSIISAINDIVTTTTATTAPAPLSPTGNKLSFSTTDINGKSVSMSTYSGSKIIIVNMWEPWCGPCVREMPDLQKLYENYKSKGLLVIGVYSTEENAQSTVESNGITYPIIKNPPNSINLTRVTCPQRLLLTDRATFLQANRLSAQNPTVTGSQQLLLILNNFYGGSFK